MGKGLFFGMIWGVIVSVVLLSVASLALPLPGDPPRPAALATDPAPDAAELQTDENSTDEGTGLSDGDAVGDAAPVADTASAKVPVAPSLETSMVAPSLPETVDAPDSQASPAVSLSPDVVQPQMPDVEGNATISEEPVQPAPPEVESTAPVVGLEGTGPELTSPVIENATVPAGEDSTELAMAAPDTDTPEVAAPSEDVSDTPDERAPLPPPLALEAFAVPFANPEDRPILSIVLMDGGASPFPAELLDGLSVQVSFAVEAGTPRAAARMKQYRDAGYEVLVIPAVVPGSTLSEMDAALDAALIDVSEAVAFLDPFETGYTQQTDLVEQGISRLLETGHGLLHVTGDATNPDVVALRAGVPSLSVSRDFDAQGESPRTIMRFLDGAAFKARQQGVVVMLGRTRPETFEAITLWAERSRATSVAIAPISAAFRAEAGG